MLKHIYKNNFILKTAQIHLMFLKSYHIANLKSIAYNYKTF